MQLSDVVVNIFQLSRSSNTKWAVFGLCHYCIQRPICVDYVLDKTPNVNIDRTGQTQYPSKRKKKKTMGPDILSTSTRAYCADQSGVGGGLPTVA